MKIREFFEVLRQYLAETHPGVVKFYDRYFPDEFVQNFSCTVGTPKNWQELDLETTQDWQILYQVIINVLSLAALENYKAHDPTVFKTVTIISDAFCKTLQNRVRIKIEPETVRVSTAALAA